MANSRLRVHVLYEHSDGMTPHGCGEIRLLKPLAHPSLQSRVDLSFGCEIPVHQVDILIIERLWNYSCEWQDLYPSLLYLRQQGTKIIYEIDDDLLSVNMEIGTAEHPTAIQKMWIRQMSRFADGLIVSTQVLAKRFETLNANIEIVPNCLDEELFESVRNLHQPEGQNDPVVFGYMGTYTHFEDLLTIIQPLRACLNHFGSKVRFEIIGIGNDAHIESLFGDLPVKVLTVPSGSVPYPQFIKWLCQGVKWDFGIAPLKDTVFSRSKSDIKFLDYSSLGIPGIYSDVPAYSESVKQMENGLLASNSSDWFDSLSMLISDQRLRKRLAQKAHDYVWNERMLEMNAFRWVDALDKLISNSPEQSCNVSSSLYQRMSPPGLSRNEKLLYSCNMDGVGLEIGPSFCPVVSKKSGYRIETLDHADADTLREKYKNSDVDVAKIEQVDYVWSGEPLHELTGKKDYYSWIIASHVIEHTPDMISFLQQCETMLAPDGVLCLAVPDQRYCFDIFRPPSTPGDVIQAFHEQRKKHTLGAIWDHYSMISKKGDVVSWEKGYQGAYSPIHPTLDDACTKLKEAQAENGYIDVHNWRFTPSFFNLLILDIRLLDYSSFGIKSFYGTQGCEFIVQLQKGMPAPDVDTINTERSRLMLQALGELKEER